MDNVNPGVWIHGLRLPFGGGLGVHFWGSWVGCGFFFGLLVFLYLVLIFSFVCFLLFFFYKFFITHRFSMVPLACPVGLFGCVTSRLPRFPNKITPYDLILFVSISSNPHRSRCNVSVFIFARRGAGSASGASSASGCGTTWRSQFWDRQMVPELGPPLYI